MTPEALERLRERVRGHVVKMSHVPETCELCAIRALLDAYEQAVGALGQTEETLRGYTYSDGKPTMPAFRASAIDRARAVLKQAGRR